MSVAPADLIQQQPLEVKILSAAVRLLLGDDARTLRALMEQNPDPANLLTVARWHRLEGHVLKALQQLELPIPDGLAEDCSAIAQTNMMLTGMMTHLVRRFREEAIPLVVLKGPILAMQLYGDLGMRRSRDIDLLILPEDLRRVRDLLIKEGFTPETHEEGHIYDLLLATDKEIKLHKAGIMVELHWRATPIKDMFPMDPQWIKAPHFVTLAGEQVPVLPPDVDLVYLANHAARHIWFRLFWLVDICFWATRPEVDWPAAVARAKDMGQTRPFGLTIYLAHLLGGCPIHPDVRDLLVADPVMRKYAEIRLNTMALIKPKDGNYRLGAPLIPNYIWQMRFFPHLRGKIFRRLFFTPTVAEVTSFPLPKGLFFLHYLLRPFRLVTRLIFNPKY